ncbi:MAG: hypothetical protein NT113_04350 [Hyphomicrobiales bacterium]|nr:hypothetical protein [Hyphomicrobiales bacterium]
MTCSGVMFNFTRICSGEVAINLDDMQHICLLDQLIGQRALTRPDFGDMLARPQRHRRENSGDYPLVGKKMLTEALPRDMFHRIRFLDYAPAAL